MQKPMRSPSLFHPLTDSPCLDGRSQKLRKSSPMSGRSMMNLPLLVLLRPRLVRCRSRHAGGRGHGLPKAAETIMITDRTFRSFLNCRRKAFLQTAGSPGEQPDIERVQLDLDPLYRRRALEAFLGACQPCDVVYDPTSWAAVSGATRLIVNVTVGDHDLQ